MESVRPVVGAYLASDASDHGGAGVLFDENGRVIRWWRESWTDEERAASICWREYDAATRTLLWYWTGAWRTGGLHDAPIHKHVRIAVDNTTAGSVLRRLYSSSIASAW